MLKTLRGKIVLGYLVLAGLILVVAIVSITNIDRLTGSINKIMAENYRSVTAAERMIMALERQDSMVLLYLHGEDDYTISEFHAAQNEFVKWLGRAEDNITLEGEGEIIERIGDEYGNYVEMFSEIRMMDSDGVEDIRERRMAYYLRDVIGVFRDLEDDIEQLLGLNHQSMLEARRSADSVGRAAVLSTVVGTVAALIVGGAASFYMSTIIVKPTKDLTELIERIEPGNVGDLEAAERPDELGFLTKAINEMIQRLRKYDERIISRLQSEQDRSHAIVESITDGTLVVDEQMRVQMVNETARRLFQIRLHHIGRHLLEAANDDRLFQAIQRAMETGETQELRGPEYNWIIQDGKRRRYFELAASPVLQEGGGIIGAVANFREVTHYHEIEQLKTDIMSTVTHEFRTPLTSLSMNIALLAEHTDEIAEIDGGEDLGEMIEEMEADLDRLLHLVDNVLTLSKLESGNLPIEKELISLSDVVENGVGPFYRQAEEAGVELSVYGVEEMPKVFVDPTKVAWVISNLVGNALRYTDAGGKITVNAEERGTRIAVSVSDTGTGIPKEVQERIFDKFMQVAAEGRQVGGAGLGLAISQEVIRAHGERIWVESEEGEGSTFTFTLPKAG
ncbi:MAG: ATP-binding protein [Bacillota bacterium]